MRMLSTILASFFIVFSASCRDIKIIKIGARTYPATLIKIVDGDTMDLAVDLGFNLTLKGRFRILNLDTYESRLIRGPTPAEKIIGLRAKQYAAEILKNQPLKVIVYSWKKDPYGRWLCQVKFAGKNYAAEMKKQGFQKVKK